LTAAPTSYDKYDPGVGIYDDGYGSQPIDAYSSYYQVQQVAGGCHGYKRKGTVARRGSIHRGYGHMPATYPTVL